LSCHVRWYNWSSSSLSSETCFLIQYYQYFWFKLCDPKQPYRRGDAGSQSIRIMAHPNQPMWRLFSEIIVRLKVTHQRSKNDRGQGNARLWKRASADANSR
jgi:hypothetical protein